MKKLINLLINNWVAKLISLIIAVVIWFLIDSQIKYQPRLYKKTLHQDTWTD